MAAIDGLDLYIRKAPVIFAKGRTHVPGREGCMDADRQLPLFAATSAFQAPELRIHLIEDPLGTGNKLKPIAVRWVPRFVGWNNTTPSRRSMSHSLRLKVDWRMPRASAACLMAR